MRTNLAETLLTRIMEWSPDEVRKELPLLQALSNFKYDEYQQFSPGMRFVESLVKWLTQFKSLNEKNIAYNFIKTQIIFFSSEQISHLVTLTYTEKVEPLLIEKTALEIGINRYKLKSITSSDNYSENRRRVLYLGLSDGSKIDFFRRCSGINNEQVSSTYHISKGKADDMISKLKQDINKDKFNTVFLIDDFTASGISYFREEEGESEGKMIKILNSLFYYDDSLKNENSISMLIKSDDVSVNILFYIATSEALVHINNSINKWKNRMKCSAPISADAIQVIEKTTTNTISNNPQFITILKDYFDPSIIDSHYEKGKHIDPYLGFNECALPVILYHNTPNNSLPILWMQEDKSFTGLFPRVTRHKE
jgi:uncharacterized protein involved in tolerance to divalent cations